MTYYIDPAHGCAENSGTSPKQPLGSVSDRRFYPGDTVLFRRGSVIRQELMLDSGSAGAPIIYGAYGTGADPVVDPSLDASQAEMWKEERPGLWRFDRPIPSEMCNIVFDNGASFGNLRWSVDELKKTGEWYYDRLGFSICGDTRGGGTLYLVCPRNPAQVYRRIALILWGARQAVTVQCHAVIEDMAFTNVGVHGFSAIHAQDITIRRCRFSCIGGAVFDRQQRVRFGNGIEFWNGASDCRVEHCIFEDIYDSGVTHQGNAESLLAERLSFCYNEFRRCGLAAYEWRGPISRDVLFAHNHCTQAGGAFTMQGEPAPRRTETLEPIRACVFVLIWLCERELPGNCEYCAILDNDFEAAAGCEAILLSTVDQTAFRRFRIENNRYTLPAGQPLALIGGRAYTAEQSTDYRRDSGKDAHSRFSVLPAAGVSTVAVCVPSAGGAVKRIQVEG